jgi:hypothetical protein
MTKKMRRSGGLLVLALFLSSSFPALIRAQKAASPAVQHLTKKAGVARQ